MCIRDSLRTHRHSHYCGVVDSKDSVGVLKKYYCLLFPTLFQTEGIPGTIIDGFAAALPVICSDWVRCRQIVTDGVDGIVYPFGDAKALENSVKYAVQNPSYVEQLKHGALKSVSYTHLYSKSALVLSRSASNSPSCDAITDIACESFGGRRSGECVSLATTWASRCRIRRRTSSRE